ncbi:MAG: prolyl oligopeptidase family serine peptidase [Armatimonadetes bacterium]|nr:prolyl oligopeptidase family serine peptidase [Armatimonadota bacterium]
MSLRHMTTDGTPAGGRQDCRICCHAARRIARWSTFALLTSWTLAMVSCARAGHARLVTYISPVDGTEQAYGVYVPSSEAPATGYPAIFHGHGYGWHVSADFDDFQRRWADEHGWVLININARGPTFYEGIGQQAVLEVVEDAVSRFGLDRRRLFFTGASMGGTGAFRQGVRYPEIFAAVAAVDGWADWRIWHWKWYARTDQREDIEEFRRPLLASCAPVDWAERAMWGQVRAIIDGRDDVVEPDEGLRLSARLAELRETWGAGYRWDQLIHYDRGHGGGYDLAAIYEYFLRCAPAGIGPRLALSAWRLTDARQGWLAITGLRQFGKPGRAGSCILANRISVWTDNVSRLTVYPAEAAEHLPSGPCEVWVDGQRLACTATEPVHAKAVFDATGTLLCWELSQETTADTSLLCPIKCPALEGPIGDAFTQPFVVAYAADGTPEQVARHRREAEAFVTGWNDFFVHGLGLRARREDDLQDEELATANLVLFGCLDCSRLLRQAQRQKPLPLQVFHDRVIVFPDDAEPRCYAGSKFGCFFVYPNPLCAGKRYLVVASGQWFTRPDGSVPQGLEYDLEKLPWAYPDYVVFNSNQAELPFVLNVNNKPPVTCYEAGYFCEAGYFDQNWRLKSDAVAEWVQSVKPARARLIYVSELRHARHSLSLRVTDATGAPVHNARVTVASANTARSGVPQPDGWVFFEGLPDGLTARVLSVMATGCAYDRQSNCLAATDVAAALGGLAGARYCGPKSINCGAPPTRLSFNVTAGPEKTVYLEADLTAARGTVIAESPCSFALRPGQQATLSWLWRDEGDFVGDLELTLVIRARSGNHQATAKLRALVEVAGLPPSLLSLAEPSAEQDASGDWVVSGTAWNGGDQETEMDLMGMVPQANYPLELRKVRLGPGGSEKVTWRIPAGLVNEWIGPASVVVYDENRTGVVSRTEIALTLPGGTSLAGGN